MNQILQPCVICGKPHGRPTKHCMSSSKRRARFNNLLRERGPVCVFCRKTFSQDALKIHHITPRSTCGCDDISNLVLTCQPCHKRAHQDPVSKRKWIQPPLDIAKARQVADLWSEARKVNPRPIMVAKCPHCGTPSNPKMSSRCPLCGEPLPPQTFLTSHRNCYTAKGQKHDPVHQKPVRLQKGSPNEH